MADTKRKRPAEVLTEAEVRSLLAACSRRAPTGIRDRALITVLYRAGLRIEEALDLKPADVDPGRGTIRVLHGKGDHQVRQMVKRRAAKAEITKRVHPHALRHTHAAELVAEGVPVNVIAMGPQPGVDAIGQRHPSGRECG